MQTRQFFLTGVFKVPTAVLSVCAIGLGVFGSSFPGSSATATQACGIQEPCVLSERSYQALAPDNWNGDDDLPVLIHFHGWGRTGSNVVNNREIGGATRKTGVLLLAPNGYGKSWSFWREGSRDIPFVEEMIEDAAKRWPINRNRIFVSGFSYGAAMAWRLACERGGDYAAFLSIAGTLWNFEELEHCSSPVMIRHVHGLKDTVMDLPLGHGGDPLYSVSPWLKRNGCSKKPDATSTEGIFSKNVWTVCTSGHDVELELHNSGHIIPKGWMKRQLQRLQRDNRDS